MSFFSSEPGETARPATFATVRPTYARMSYVDEERYDHLKSDQEDCLDIFEKLNYNRIMDEAYEVVGKYFEDWLGAICHALDNSDRFHPDKEMEKSKEKDEIKKMLRERNRLMKKIIKTAGLADEMNLRSFIDKDFDTKTDVEIDKVLKAIKPADHLRTLLCMRPETDIEARRQEHLGVIEDATNLLRRRVNGVVPPPLGDFRMGQRHIDVRNKLKEVWKTLHQCLPDGEVKLNLGNKLDRKLYALMLFPYLFCLQMYDAKQKADVSAFYVSLPKSLRDMAELKKVYDGIVPTDIYPKLNKEKVEILEREIRHEIVVLSVQTLLEKVDNDNEDFDGREQFAHVNPILDYSSYKRKVDENNIFVRLGVANSCSTGLARKLALKMAATFYTLVERKRDKIAATDPLFKQMEEFYSTLRKYLVFQNIYACVFSPVQGPHQSDESLTRVVDQDKGFDSKDKLEERMREYEDARRIKDLNKIDAMDYKDMEMERVKQRKPRLFGPGEFSIDPSKRKGFTTLPSIDIARKKNKRGADDDDCEEAEEK